MTKTLSAQAQKELQGLIADYPTKKSALLPALRVVEHEFGAVDEDGMALVAEALDLPPAHVWGVASFYTHYKRPWHGRHRIMVCRTLSCSLRGAGRIMDHLHARLGIAPGETTADGLFSLEAVECLASCGTAPAMQIDDRHFENLTVEQVDAILEGYRRGNPPDPDRDRGAPPGETVHHRGTETQRHHGVSEI